MSLTKLTPGTWTIDSSHSSVAFTARHLMVSKVRGRFGTFSGTITVAPDPLQSSVEATVETGSITTNDDNRDGHLRSPDFFDVERYPTMSLHSTRIEQRGGDHLLHADLTVKGVTRPVVFTLEFEGVESDPWGGTRAGFSAETEINRKDWGLEWNVALETGGVLVGEKVKVQLDVQAVQVVPAPAGADAGAEAVSA
jgi:polyisoprenoid-binding protein YceI